MKFILNKLGPLQSANLELGDLTIICGKNNTGKTYISYSIYGFLKLWQSLCKFKIDKENVEILLREGFVNIDLNLYLKDIQNILVSLSEGYKESLKFIFSTDNDFFLNSSFQVLIDDYTIDFSKEHQRSSLSSKNKKIISAYKAPNSSILELSALTEDKKSLPTFVLNDFINGVLSEIFFSDYFKNTFIVTSERTGISLFYKELDIHKNVLVEQITNQTRDKNHNFGFESFFDLYDKVLSRYAKPIKDNIDFIRDFDSVSKNKSFLFESKNSISKFIEGMIGGTFKVNDDQLFFIDKKTKSAIPIHITSSAIKSLIGLNYYLKHIAKPNDILIIDEPELTLHPDNQRKMARLIVRLINQGIKVIITTHSDYLLKELNTLIMLSNDFPTKESFMKKYKYDLEEVIDFNKIKAYATSDGSLKEVNINKYGLEIETFDKEINEMNKISDEIYFSLD